MLTDLNKESMKIGLKINKTKTKIMFNDKVTPNEIKINGKTLEEVEECVYLGKRITLKKDHDDEIKRRIKIGWKTSGINRDVLKSKMPMCLKRKVYNQCVIPAMTKPGN